ncbi:MAG: type II secretion system F family protein [Planctomycetes bacterium]|jgi:tight adherence protein C|nr:type II secretion system F family protein [Planctomycetota bacterium]
MSISIQIVIFAAAMLGFLGIANLFAQAKENKQRNQRLGGRSHQTHPGAQEHADLKSMLSGGLESVGKLLSTSQNQFKLQENLQRAGYYGPRPVTVFLGARAATAIALPAAFLLYQSVLDLPLKLVVVAVATLLVLGLRLPGFWLARKVKQRCARLKGDLPDCLDLMIVCVESGLGIDAALLKISDKMSITCADLSQELRLVHLEMQAGNPRQQSLRNLAQRTGVKEIQSLVAKLIQSEKFGTSVAKALRVHADTIREKRKQAAEERAGKTAVKMLFPLIFCIFPALFVAILGPAIIQMLATLGGGLG